MQIVYPAFCNESETSHLRLVMKPSNCMI